MELNLPAERASSAKYRRLIAEGKHSASELLESAIICIQMSEEDWIRQHGPSAQVKRDRWWATYNAAITGCLSKMSSPEMTGTVTTDRIRMLAGVRRVATDVANAAHGKIE